MRVDVCRGARITLLQRANAVLALTQVKETFSFLARRSVPV